MTAQKIQSRLSKLASPNKAKILSRFFKTGPGEYGEGDKFRGIMVPQLRSTAQIFSEVSLIEALKLLKSPYNEDRCTALFILTKQFQSGDEPTREKIFKYYLSHIRHINNWNLVDLSAYKIVGAHLFEKERLILYKLANSKNLWERRVAIVSTFYFIQNKQLKDTFQLSRMLLDDQEDLMHKACGWMLREAGKRDKKALVNFLKEHQNRMPRTMLRYAIEKFPQSERQKWLKKT